MANSEVSKRIISAIILIPAALVAVWLGGVPFSCLLVVAGGLISWELSRLVFKEEQQLARYCLSAGVVAVLAAHFFLHPFLTLPLLGVGIGLGLYIAVMREGPRGWTVFAYLFCVLPVLGLYFLRADMVYGLSCVLWLFACVWATDICAYFAGRKFGGPKLAPAISPNKTWSGLAGGVAAAGLVGLMAALVLQLSIVPLIIISAVVAIVAQGGDLLESHLKRRAGVKDSGALIPGHGGVLDRVDGLISASFFGACLGILRGGFDQAGKGLISW